MKKIFSYIFIISLLSGCHIISEREHESVMKIPQTVYNLNKTDQALLKSNGELRKKAEKIEKEQATLKRSDQRVVTKVSSLGKDVKVLKTTVAELKVSMKKEIEAQKVEIKQLSEHTAKLTLQDKLVFNKRSVHITRAGRHLLNDFAKVVVNAASPIHIRIVGHTDDLPISKFQRNEFLDNWELSADRAAAVARYLIWAGKLDGSMMHIEGRADTQPVVPNTSNKNRSQNRRVELYLENASFVAANKQMDQTSSGANPCATNPCATKKNPCQKREPEVTPIM
ncbi:MAG: OmpA family protein [Mariprofundaceae bacterium]|nr:OmpA family protein [Mariprofundaceae bacterium]